jgi:hypothetical protein
MLKRLSHSTVIYTGYVMLLLAFVSLGLFVAALAYGSGLVAVAGAAMVAFLIAAVIGFAVGARKLADAAAGSTYKLSIWSRPLVPAQVDHYHVSYRGRETRRRSPTTVALAESEERLAA